MTLILKHKRSRATKRVRFKTKIKGRLFQFGGFVNVTDVDPEKTRHMINKMGYEVLTDYSVIPNRIARRLKVDKVKVESGETKICSTEGCANTFKMGTGKGAHFRKYCDICQAIKT